MLCLKGDNDMNHLGHVARSAWSIHLKEPGRDTFHFLANAYAHAYYDDVMAKYSNKSSDSCQ